MRFEWDEAKNAANKRKHGVSFEDASELFSSGEAYLELFDVEHSDDEDRFICVGVVRLGAILVGKTEPREDVVRIISARMATERESKLFAMYIRGRKS
jgi:uncharacterized DUF497 family protein